jgi:uncharacterized protein YhaN
MAQDARNVRNVRPVIVGIAVVALIGAVIAERLTRRTIERSYQQALAARERLEREFADILQGDEQLKSQLTLEHYRSSLLARELGEQRGELAQALDGLAEQDQTIRELGMRVAMLRQQLDQLQGELAIALRERPARHATGDARAVELERIIVSDGASTGWSGRVLAVDANWNFVVVDLGWDAVKIGDMVSIFRNERLLAKARIERVQEQLSAASILPEWESAEIRINDSVRGL